MSHKDTSKDRPKKITQQEVTWEYSSSKSAKEDDKSDINFFLSFLFNFPVIYIGFFPLKIPQRCMQKGIVFLSMKNFNKDYTIIFFLLPLIEFKWFWVERRWKNGRLSSRKEMIFFMCHMKVWHHLRGVALLDAHII
jgi:hypothetical protein